MSHLVLMKLKNVIKNKKNGKNSGPALISNEAITDSSITTIKSITKLLNLILDSGCYPTSWIKSYTILIFKSRDKTDMNNNRGISLQNLVQPLMRD